MRLRPGTLVLLEGVEKSGKSTQLVRLGERFPDAVTLHSPSGGSELGEAVYRLTETVPHLDPLGRQLLHLAAHCQMYRDVVIPTLEAGQAVILDRGWLSTMAYGWAAFRKVGLEYQHIKRIATLPTLGVVPIIIFGFMYPHDHDPLNTNDLRHRYRHLFEMENARVVPSLDADLTTDWLVDNLRSLTVED